jgi:co-chaperonin GroES (HSP10)
MSNDNSSYSPNYWPTSGTQVSSPMIPPGGGNTGGLTHYAKYGHGGYRSVKTMNDRDALSFKCLELGMMVNVTGDNNISNNGLWILDSIDENENLKWKRLGINSQISDLNMLVFKYDISTGNTVVTENYATIKLITYDDVNTDIVEDNLVLKIVDVQNIKTLAENSKVSSSITMNVYRTNGDSTDQTATLQCIQLGNENNPQYSLRIFR